MRYKCLLILTIFTISLAFVQIFGNPEEPAYISVDQIAENSLNTVSDSITDDILLFPDEDLVTPNYIENRFETQTSDTTDEVTTFETTEATTTYGNGNKFLIDAPQRLCGENMRRDRHGKCRPIF